jgi:uncharacterized protein YecE (DUF72 family)
MKEGKKVYVYFDNTMEDDDVSEAMKLSHMDCLDRNPEVLY